MDKIEDMKPGDIVYIKARERIALILSDGTSLEVFVRNASTEFANKEGIPTPYGIKSDLKTDRMSLSTNIRIIGSIQELYKLIEEGTNDRD